MPLAREQRIRLARVLGWSRSNNWIHDVYPNTWRSGDGQIHVRFDSIDEQLVIDRILPDQDPLRCRVALVPVDSPDLALRVLAALGHIPVALTIADDAPTDEQARTAYHALTAGNRHAYMSTYCQHGLHDECRRTCKCCDAACLCTGCLHPAPAPPSAHAGLSLPCDVCGPRCAVDDKPAEDADSFDGPASFTEAGQAFADLVDGRVMPDRAAETLSTLARSGLIVSTTYHDETVSNATDAPALFDLADVLAFPESSWAADPGDFQ